MITTNESPIIMAIDDQKFYLDEIGYELRGKDIEYLPFLGPSIFEEDVREIDFDRTKLILVDYDFCSCTVMDRDLVGYIRDRYSNFKGKIVLLSLLADEAKNDEAVCNDFDAIVNKRDLSWELINSYLK